MKKWLVFILVCLLILAGCKDEEAVPPSEQQGTGSEGHSESLDYKTPLSGQAIAVQSTDRPVVVTINNHPLARPQSGLEQADVVIELIAESSITRLLAVYQSELPQRIGPVRSARDYFIDLAKGYQAFYVAHGYSPEAKQMLDAGVIDHMNGMQYDGTYFKRSSDRKAPHNSYTSGEAIEAAAKERGATLTLAASQMPSYSFSEDAQVGESATEVTIRYSNDANFTNVYSYDETTERYTRSSGTTTTVDAESGNPLELSNVVVVEVPHRTIDDEGRQALDLESGGNAWLFRDGGMIQGTWKLDNGLIRLYTGNQEMTYKPGQTWMSIIPTARGFQNMVTYTE